MGEKVEGSGAPVREHPRGCVIDVRVHPSSPRRGIDAGRGGRVQVFVHSPPREGRANKEVLKELAAALDIAPSRLELLRGQASRDKTVLARGISAAEAMSRLELFN